MLIKYSKFFSTFLSTCGPTWGHAASTIQQVEGIVRERLEPRHSSPGSLPLCGNQKGNVFQIT